MPGGRLCFYQNGNFQAECDSHGTRCTLTRKGRDAKAVDKGRPLGLLMQWLGVGPLTDDASHPTDPDFVRPSFERRKLYREELLALPGSEDLFKYERGYNPESPDLSEPAVQR